MPTRRPRAKHDEAYRLLFSNPALVEGLLSTMVPGLPDLIEPASLRKASASFVKAAGLQQRHGDAIWRTRLRRPDRHPLFIALEFQSRPEANMAFRVQEYAALVLQEAETQRDLGAAGRPPIVAPFVVYNGHAKWGAATDLADWIVPDPGPALRRLLGLQMRRRYILVELKDLVPEPSDSPPGNWFSVLAEWENARWGRNADRLAGLWRTVLESGDEGIIRGFGALRRQLAPGLPEPDITLMAATPPGRRKTMIRHEETLMAAQLRKLYEELRQEGREEGRREGLHEGLREGLREGRHEGRREGLHEGRRSLLRQLAVQKFGPEVVGELVPLFDRLTDPARVDTLAAAVIECDTGAEFISRARGA